MGNYDHAPEPVLCSWRFVHYYCKKCGEPVYATRIKYCRMFVGTWLWFHQPDGPRPHAHPIEEATT